MIVQKICLEIKKILKNSKKNYLTKKNFKKLFYKKILKIEKSDLKKDFLEIKKNFQKF